MRLRDCPISRPPPSIMDIRHPWPILANDNSRLDSHSPAHSRCARRAYLTPNSFSYCRSLAGSGPLSPLPENHRCQSCLSQLTISNVSTCPANVSLPIQVLLFSGRHLPINDTLLRWNLSHRQCKHRSSSPEPDFEAPPTAISECGTIFSSIYE